MTENRRDVTKAKQNPPVQVSAADMKKFAATMLASFKMPGENVVANPKAFMKAMQSALSAYPIDVLQEAYRRALASEEWFPSTAAMVKHCQAVMAERQAEERRARKEEAERREWEKQVQRLEERRRHRRAFLDRLYEEVRLAAVMPKEAAETALEGIENLLGEAEAVRWLYRLENGEERAVQAGLIMWKHWRDHAGWPPLSGDVGHPREVTQIAFWSALKE